MLRHLLLASLTVVGLAAPVSAQTFFSDNFNRVTLGSPVPGPGGAYASNTPAGSAVTVTGSVLQIANATGTSNDAFTASQVVGYTTLTGVARPMEWRFNMKSSILPTGFNGSQFGVAVALAASTTNFNTAFGYAVVFGRNGSNVIELVSFTGGLDANANLTSIIASGTNPLGAGGTDFGSVRVTFNPLTNNWQLFVRDDGTTAFANPMTGTISQVGATTANNTFVGSTVNQTGFYFNYNTAGQNAQFDNMTIAAIPEPTTWALIGLGTVALGGGFWRLRRKNSAILNSEVVVDEAAE
ncbi:MAG TPA: PEP-CTERM sorting domain-containing protein [Gemmatales bacterium]|nr:PEP-CTERM sorting domain-containing protein [Gemmatales bacterium]